MPALVVLSTSSIWAQNSLLPDNLLTIGAVSLDASQQTVTVEVTNRTNQNVTAYAIQFNADPMAVTRHDWFNTIGLEKTNPGMQEVGGIHPGNTRKEVISWDKQQVPAVKVVAVVLDDRHAFGDEEQIKDIFDHRAGAAAELKELCSMLDEATASAKTVEERKSAYTGLAKQLRERSNGASAHSMAEAGSREQQTGMIQTLETAREVTGGPTVVQYFHARCAVAPLHSVRNLSAWRPQ